jgi:diguanylate cyclase (GGDEF)-like protein/PAS domain S-box-containing protein
VGQTAPECVRGPAGDELGSMADAFVNLPDAVVLVDGSGTVVWGNRAAERLFELKLNDWIGQSGLQLVHPDDHEFVLRSLVTVQGKDVGTPIEIRIKAASGWRLIEMIGTPMEWRGGEVILLSMRDLTERRRFELASGREALFRSLVHNAGSIIMLVSPEGVIESVSAVITRLLGHDPEVLEGRPFVDIVAQGDRQEFANALSAAAEGATSAHPITARIGLRRHNGTAAVPFELSIVNLLDDPTVEGFVISAHDATAQVSAEQELGDALSRLTATLDSTADGLLVVDTAGVITDFNRRFVEIWGIPDDAVRQREAVVNLKFALDQLTDPEAFRAKFRELEANPESEGYDLLEFKDGRVVERFSRPQLVEGRAVGRVYSFRDVTDRKLLEDELAYRAFHDSLTRLANKSLFQDRLKHALARLERTGSRLAVLFLDLDNFKTVNDSLGHGEGDQLLRWVAMTLTDLLGPSDTAARLGGDEFAVLIEDVHDAEPVVALAQRILDALRPPVRLGTKSISAACSIGIAFDEEDMTADQLLRNADIAMYQAKRRGKDRYELYRDEMHTFVLARMELEEELKVAIRDDGLEAYYQPCMDLRTMQVAGFEALVRWPHPEGTLVDPRHFVPLAQEIGLIGDIDAFVLRSACRQVRVWQDAGLCARDFHISVNLSAGQLAEPDLASRIERELEDLHFDPRCLILEITESEVITDNEATLRNLAALRLGGVRIALDDFGTGYSTFLHLDRLPIDIVKIDKSLVDNLGSADDKRSLAAALVQLAHTLGYGTIAEGVENAAQQEGLRELGCVYAQGYHLGKPMDANAARWLLAAHDAPHSAGGALSA